MNDDNLIKKLKTPHKHARLVITPSYKAGEFDSIQIDCPFPFYHEGRYYMTYVGFDGTGYQTGIAVSDDLINWEQKGLLLGRGPKGSVTEYNAALTCILRENELFGPGNLKTVNGRFVGTYHAYPEPGYEKGPGVIGLCYSDDLQHWDVGPPVLEPDPSCEWEAGGLYKSWLLEADGMYYLFYNAKDTFPNPEKLEQTGFAMSDDLEHWERFPGNPVIQAGERGAFDDRFASDPCVLKHDSTWLMFYYGNSFDGPPRDSVAFSDDLRYWRKTNEIITEVGEEGDIDSKAAHKPGMISRDNQLYHFYVAASPPKEKQHGERKQRNIRGIAVATN